MADYDVQEEFGRRVHEYRKKKGLTQEKLAEAIGKSVDTISNIERGVTSTRIHTANKIASVLGVPLANLYHVAPSSPEEIERQALIREIVDQIETCDSQTLSSLLQITALAVELTGRSRLETERLWLLLKSV